MQKKKDNVIYIGSGWDKTFEGKNGTFSIVNLAFKGNYEKDEYEVVLRKKETGEEYLLNQKGMFTSLVRVLEKKTEASPDYNIQLTIKE